MKEGLAFLLLGLAPGALIAGLGISLVLQYRGSGLINLATGAIATFGAFVFYGLRVEGDLFFFVRIPLGQPWSTIPALVVSLAACVLFGVLLDRLLVRPLRDAPVLPKLILSLGLLLGLQAVFALVWGDSGQSAPNVLPDPSHSVTIFGEALPVATFLLAGIVVAVASALAVVYRYTSFGLSTRAAAEEESHAMLIGLSPDSLSMRNTVLACLVAGGVGILAAPTTTLDPLTIALVVVPALGAALLAGFTSFGIAAAAGLAMGAIQSLLVYLQTKSWFPSSNGAPIQGVADLFYFVVIAVTLALRGRGLPSRGTLLDRRLPPAPEARGLALPLALVTITCVAALFLLPFDFRQALITTLIGVILCLALVVIIGHTGLVSLVHIALGGVAAFALVRLATVIGIGFPLAPLLAVMISMLFGLAAAVPALRVRGASLAILTLAAAVALERFGFGNPVWGEDYNALPLPAPRIFGLSLGPHASIPGWDGKVPSPVVGLECLVLAIAACVLVANLRRSPFGRQMLAVRSNEPAAAAIGISVRNVKAWAFVLSSGLAGVAGVLTAYESQTVTSSQFNLVTALGFVAFAYLGGITTLGGAWLGALSVPGGLFGYALQKWTGLNATWIYLLGGVTLVGTVLYYPKGMALAVQAQFTRFRRPAPRAAPPPEPAA
jgi:branched-chain amino acid transport system permease protein